MGAAALPTAPGATLPRMPRDSVAYLLLAADVVVVALVLLAPLYAVVWLLGRRRRAAQTPASAAAPDGRQLRRCERCGLLWKGTPGHDVGRVSLRLRRWLRRRRRAQKRAAPAWAQRQGWSRCPRCLSAKVRASRAQATDR